MKAVQQPSRLEVKDPISLKSLLGITSGAISRVTVVGLLAPLLPFIICRGTYEYGLVIIRKPTSI